MAVTGGMGDEGTAERGEEVEVDAAALAPSGHASGGSEGGVGGVGGEEGGVVSGAVPVEYPGWTWDYATGQYVPTAGSEGVAAAGGSEGMSGEEMETTAVEEKGEGMLTTAEAAEVGGETEGEAEPSVDGQVSGEGAVAAAAGSSSASSSDQVAASADAQAVMGAAGAPDRLPEHVSEEFGLTGGLMADMLTATASGTGELSSKGEWVGGFEAGSAAGGAAAPVVADGRGDGSAALSAAGWHAGEAEHATGGAVTAESVAESEWQPYGQQGETTREAQASEYAQEQQWAADAYPGWKFDPVSGQWVPVAVEEGVEGGVVAEEGVVEGEPAAVLAAGEDAEGGTIAAVGAVDADAGPASLGAHLEASLAAGRGSDGDGDGATASRSAVLEAEGAEDMGLHGSDGRGAQVLGGWQGEGGGAMHNEAGVGGGAVPAGGLLLAPAAAVEEYSSSAAPVQGMEAESADTAAVDANLAADDGTTAAPSADWQQADTAAAAAGAFFEGQGEDNGAGAGAGAGEGAGGASGVYPEYPGWRWDEVTCQWFPDEGYSAHAAAAAVGPEAGDVGEEGAVGGAGQEHGHVTESMPEPQFVGASEDASGGEEGGLQAGGSEAPVQPLSEVEEVQRGAAEGGGRGVPGPALFTPALPSEYAASVPAGTDGEGYGFGYPPSGTNGEYAYGAVAGQQQQQQDWGGASAGLQDQPWTSAPAVWGTAQQEGLQGAQLYAQQGQAGGGYDPAQSYGVSYNEPLQSQPFDPYQVQQQQHMQPPEQRQKLAQQPFNPYQYQAQQQQANTFAAPSHQLMPSSSPHPSHPSSLSPAAAEAVRSTAGRPPHAVLAFGFGGRLLLCLPSQPSGGAGLRGAWGGEVQVRGSILWGLSCLAIGYSTFALERGRLVTCTVKKIWQAVIPHLSLIVPASSLPHSTPPPPYLPPPCSFLPPSLPPSGSPLCHPQSSQPLSLPLIPSTPVSLLPPTLAPSTSRPCCPASPPLLS